MVALIVAVALAGPPKAKLVTGSGRSPLAISSWCWGSRCGAPIAASTKAAVAVRGLLVSVDLAFVPTHARVAIAGQTVPATVHGPVLSWRATRAGGLTVHVTGPRGWVTYVGRLRLRAS